MSNNELDERLIARARRPALQPLWDELYRRMGSSSRAVASIRLTELTSDERIALTELLGRNRLVDHTLKVSVEHVAKALGIEAAGLRSLVESLRGPLPNRAADREKRKRDRLDLWEWLASRVSLWPLESWIQRVKANGVPGGDLDALRNRLEGVARVLDVLPANGVVLSVLARTKVLDPHGLDWGKWTTNHVLSAVAEINSVPAPTNAEEARELWDRVGVVADKYSVGVTMLGLDAGCSDPLARAISSMSSSAEPVVVTLSQLQRWPIHASGDIYLFENASVLSQAAGLEWSGPPLVSTAGWPNTAVFVLCRQLRESGCQLFYHGDFDPSGIEITRYLAERAGLTPWRMTSHDYLPLAKESGTTFDGPVVDTPWDPRLAETMRARQKVVYEEDVVDSLLVTIGN